MKTGIAAFASIVLLLTAVPSALHAQTVPAHHFVDHFTDLVEPGFWTSRPNDLPSLECGPFYGRLASALGYGAECDVNTAYLSFYGALNYTHGAQNNFVKEGSEIDTSETFGAVVHFPKPGPKNIRFGLFGQVSFVRSRIAAQFAMDGQEVQFRDLSYTPTYTAGSEISYTVRHGPRLVFRVGPNFGPNAAAQDGSRIFFSAGMLVDPFHLAGRMGDGLHFYRHF
jgi:hypothetical protein